MLRPISCIKFGISHCQLGIVSDWTVGTVNTTISELVAIIKQIQNLGSASTLYQDLKHDLFSSFHALTWQIADMKRYASLIMTVSSHDPSSK
jgi:hypothetical protein